MLFKIVGENYGWTESNVGSPKYLFEYLARFEELAQGFVLFALPANLADIVCALNNLVVADMNRNESDASPVNSVNSSAPQRR